MFRKRITRFAAVLAVVALMGSLFATSAGAKNPVLTKSPVITLQEFDETGKVVFDSSMETVEGAWSMVIRRGYGGVGWAFHTSQLTPGHAYTAWMVIFNNPSACSDNVCDPGDILMDTSDPSNSPLNMEQVEAAEISMLFAGDSVVVGPNGKATLTGAVVEGAPPGQVVFGPGLTNADGAEIHLALQDHGPASSDAAVLEAQLNQYQGGCETPCVDPQASVHKVP